MVVNNVKPKISNIQWLTKNLNGNTTRISIEAVNREGLAVNYGRTLYATQQTEETKTKLVPFVDTVKVPEENTMLQLFVRNYAYREGEFDFGFIPFQMVQVSCSGTFQFSKYDAVSNLPITLKLPMKLTCTSGSGSL